MATINIGLVKISSPLGFAISQTYAQTSFDILVWTRTFYISESVRHSFPYLSKNKKTYFEKYLLNTLSD